MSQGPRGEEKKRHDELDHEHAGAGRPVPPGRELVGEPAEQGGQGLGFVVKREGAQVAPRRIPAGELHDSGEEHQPEEQPPEDQAGEARWLVRTPERQHFPRGEQESKDGGFEQERIPLEVEKNLAGARQREIRDPEQAKAEHGGDAREEQERKRDPGGTQHVRKFFSAEPPAERRQLGEGGTAELFADRGEITRGREQAARTDEGVELRPKGNKRDQVDRCEETQEQPRSEREAVAAGVRRGRRQGRGAAGRSVMGGDFSRGRVGGAIHGWRPTSAGNPWSSPRSP